MLMNFNSDNQVVELTFYDCWDLPFRASSAEVASDWELQNAYINSHWMGTTCWITAKSDLPSLLVSFVQRLHKASFPSFESFMENVVLLKVKKSLRTRHLNSFEHGKEQNWKKKCWKELTILLSVWKVRMKTF